MRGFALLSAAMLWIDEIGYGCMRCAATGPSRMANRPDPTGNLCFCRLAELDALVAAWIAAGSRCPVLSLDALAIRTIVMVMVNVSLALHVF
jgi:hypothetical protein